MLTKDRIGAVLAVAAAVIGLFLVFNGRDAGAADDDDDGPATGPSTSQIAPVPGGPIGPAVPAPGGQVAPSAPGQVQSPAQTQPPADNDGDDDDDDG